jgi:hypothetical protein
VCVDHKKFKLKFRMLLRIRRRRLSQKEQVGRREREREVLLNSILASCELKKIIKNFI